VECEELGILPPIFAHLGHCERLILVPIQGEFRHGACTLDCISCAASRRSGWRLLCKPKKKKERKKERKVSYALIIGPIDQRQVPSRAHGF